MATEKMKKTIFTNVFSKAKEENKDNNTEKAQVKNPVEYGLGFEGEEEILWDPETFEAFGKTLRINSAELARKISAHFKQTFHELKGCNIVVLANGQIAVELFFEHNDTPCPDGKMMNLESLIENKGTNLYEKMQATQNRRMGKVFTLNNETKLLLSKFMYGGTNANLPNNNKVWGNENVLREVHIPVTDPFRRGYNTDRILVRVSGLNIRSIIQEIYGDKIVTKTVADENGDTNYRESALYEVRFIKAMPDGTFIMNIEQFSSEAAQAIFIKENPVPQQYLGVQMYT